MNFLQQLDEAANIPLDQLKDKMKKDSRVKMVFQRSLNVDEIKNVDEFIRTLRYYLFSNPYVREYIQKRGDARDLSKFWWSNMDKSLKPGVELRQYTIDQLQGAIKLLFKDVGFVQKQDISSKALDNFHDWYQRSRLQLPTYTAREIGSLELRPKAAVRLFRGFLFDERSLKNEVGDLFGGEGLKFLKSVRDGTRIVDLSFDNHTVWTTDKNAAIRVALYGAQDTWRTIDDNTPRKIEKYRGVLGFVVSTLADPSEVLVDLSQTKQAMGWPPENSSAAKSMVLNPGKFTCRLVHKFTPEGEEDPVPSKSEDDVDLSHVKSQLSLLAKILKLPFPEIRFEGVDRGSWSPEIMSQVAILIRPDVQDFITKLIPKMVAVYDKHFSHLDIKKLASQAGENSSTYNAIMKMHELFSQSLLHKKHADPSASRSSRRHDGPVQFKDVIDAEDFLTAEPDYQNSKLRDAAFHIANQKRWTSWNINGVFPGFAKIADPNFKPSEKIHLLGWKDQKVLVDKAMDGFYQTIGKAKPESYAEQAKEFVEVLNKANVVSQSARFLQKLKLIAQSVDLPADT